MKSLLKVVQAVVLTAYVGAYSSMWLFCVWFLIPNVLDLVLIGNVLPVVQIVSAFLVLAVSVGASLLCAASLPSTLRDFVSKYCECPEALLGRKELVLLLAAVVLAALMTFYFGGFEIIKNVCAWAVIIATPSGLAMKCALERQKEKLAEEEEAEKKAESKTEVEAEVIEMTIDR